MKETNVNQYPEDEIDLVELSKKVYKEKKLIFKYSIIAAILGVVFALFQPNQYTSSTTFIPQLGSDIDASASSLSGLASLAGINFGGIDSSSEFPQLYILKLLKAFLLDLIYYRQTLKSIILCLL